MTDSAIETSTSPALSDEGSHDALTRWFHWATAVLVLTLYGLYLVWEQLPKGDAKHLMIVSHLSFGAVLTVVLVGRVVWRSSPMSSSQLHDGLQGLAARAVHVLLYVMLGVQVLLGWNFRWAQGQPMSVFGLLVSSPFDYSAYTRHAIAITHYWVGTAIVALAAVHAAAALFHHVVLRDDVLRRMTVGRRSPSSR